MLSYILVGLLFAGEPAELEADATIVVEARRNMVVFVEDPIIANSSEKIKIYFWYLCDKWL